MPDNDRDAFGFKKEKVAPIIPNADNIRQLSDYKKPPEISSAQLNPELVNIRSPEDAVIWACRYYSQVESGGGFFIANDRVPDKTTFMKVSIFVASIRDMKITTEYKDNKGLIRIKEIPFSELFLDCALDIKRRYLEVAFDPTRIFDRNDKTAKSLNLWKGLATKPEPGDCTLTLAYLLNIIANKDLKLYGWILDFLAHMVQKPWEKPEVALLLIGEKGVGKTFFMDLVKVLIDGVARHRHCFKTSVANDIFGDHKAEKLLHTLALLLEEVTFGGDVKNKGQINDLITGHTVTINIKNGPIITVTNVMRVIMAANPGHVILVSIDERRYTAPRVSSEHQQDHVYFSAIQDELDHGGYSALMHTLMTRDISKFNHREAYITDALIDQIDKGMSPVEQWWFNILRSGQIPFIKSESEKRDDGSICINKQVLYELYKRDMKELNSKSKILYPTKFGEALHALLPKVENDKLVMNENNHPESALGTIRLSTGYRPWLYVMPPLLRARESLEFKLRGHKLEWGETNVWEELEPNDVMLPGKDR